MNRRPPLVLLALLLLIPAAPAPPARAADARSLVVRPVAPPEEIQAQQRRGLPVRADALTPAESAVLKARLARQREFHALEQELHRRAFKLGAGSNASRRPGWRAPVAPNAPMRGGLAPSAVTQAPPVVQDTIRIALLRIDFLADRGGSASSGTGRFNLDPADSLANPVDRPPHNRDFYNAHAEALQRYYDVQSYGRVRVEVDVWPAERDSAYHLSDMADLGPWRFGNSIFRAAVDMMRLCFFAADSQSIAKSDRIPWAKYDRFDIIHAGSDLQSDIRADSKEDIPSFTIFVDDTDRIVFPDSSNRDRPIDRCSFLPETINQDDAFGAINGVIAHENGHNLFGFGDVYDIETALPVVGYWSLMDSGNLVGAKLLTASQGTIFAVGLLAPSIDPFQRNFILDAGLLNYRQPGPADTAAFTIQDGERNNDFVKVDLSADEYLILENRYLSPATAVRLLQDSLTRVVLGPRDPDRFEVDALLDGGGVLVWHIDESVIPFVTSLRVNPDFGFNTNPRRLGDQVIEADGLDDLGDTGSPFLLGSAFDPYQATVAPLLSETTVPSLIPNQGTHPHVKVEFLDDTSQNMHVRVTRSWQPKGWPVAANFPPGGPALLAADLDGDGKPEVVWAGGDTTVTDTSLAAREAVRDSAAIFAVRFDGKGLNGADTLDFAHLDRRPRPEVAAVAATPPGVGFVFATTYHYGPSDTQGGRLWAIGPNGTALAGFPVALPSPASTPPVVGGDAVNGYTALVGCEDGHVYAVDARGSVAARMSTVALTGGVSGRLAYFPTSSGGAGASGYIAAAGAGGEVVVLLYPTLTPLANWPVSVATTGFAPDFLWMFLGGSGANAANECNTTPVLPTLFVEHDDRVAAYCLAGAVPLAGWGTSLGDTLVPGLAAGDPDGDGFPEVVVQSRHSRLAYLNRTGRPSPGWPRAGTSEDFSTNSPPLALDLTGDGRPELVALNASGVIAAFDSHGRTPDGWPLATGAGCAGSPVASDLDGDGSLEIVAPDRFNRLYAYSVPGSLSTPGTSWTMLGGGPGRQCAVTDGSIATPSEPTPGPLVSGSLKAYPNPARQKPVQFAYQLSEDATVEFRILDSSGHEVANWSRAGKRSDNLEVWNPQGLPAGLYVAHIRFSGAGGARTENLPVGIVR